MEKVKKSEKKKKTEKVKKWKSEKVKKWVPKRGFALLCGKGLAVGGEGDLGFIGIGF